MLDEMQKTISMSDLTRHAERIAKDVETARTVYRIKRPGKSSMLLVHAGYFEDQLTTLEFIAQHPNWREELERGHREYLEGKSVSLEDVCRELGIEIPPAHAKRRKGSRRAPKRRKTPRR